MDWAAVKLAATCFLAMALVRWIYKHVYDGSGSGGASVSMTDDRRRTLLAAEREQAKRMGAS